MTDSYFAEQPVLTTTTLNPTKRKMLIMKSRKKKHRPISKSFQKPTIQKEKAPVQAVEPTNSEKHLLVATAQEYHSRYAEEIAYEIEFHKHLSVLMPALIGLYPLPLNLYHGLSFRCREYIIVESQEDIDEFNHALIRNRDENNCIYPILYHDFIQRKPRAGCYVLFDLSQEKRMELSALFAANKDVAIISIGRLEEDSGKAKSSMVSQAQGAISELFQITTMDGRPHCMIFPVDSILDIRDLMYANASEKTQLVSQLYSICSDYEIDYGVTDEITNVSGSAAKIALYRQMLAERDFEISILKSVAASAGIDMGGLEKEISRITEMKHEYSEKYDQTIDPLEQEKLETAFQNEVSELLVTVTSNMMTLANKNNYEEILIGHLGESIWREKLSERSRTYLISAMMTFDSMNKLVDHDELDYSGVCLQITKVLDEEMTARFFAEYKRFLFGKYLLADWPRAMKSKHGDEPLAPNDFTIGSISHVIGVGPTGYVYDPIAFNMIQEFAKQSLYSDSLSEQEVRNHLIKCVECAEKTRKDYRNPAAHRESISFVTAKECIDYLIEQMKMLKHILQDMKV